MGQRLASPGSVLCAGAGPTEFVCQGLQFATACPSTVDHDHVALPQIHCVAVVGLFDSQAEVY